MNRVSFQRQLGPDNAGLWSPGEETDLDYKCNADHQGILMGGGIDLISDFTRLLQLLWGKRLRDGGGVGQQEVCQEVSPTPALVQGRKDGVWPRGEGRATWQQVPPANQCTHDETTCMARLCLQGTLGCHVWKHGLLSVTPTLKCCRGHVGDTWLLCI